MRQILVDAVMFVMFLAVLAFVYFTYGTQVVSYITGEFGSTVYIETTPLSVTVADEEAERMQGLSGRRSLGEFQGMLFIFPEENYWSMWMKDMHIPIDIIWVDNEYRIVHIEENVSPDTFPESFAPTKPARFVIEANAFFARNANVTVGDEVTLPPRSLPEDLVDRVLQ